MKARWAFSTALAVILVASAAVAGEPAVARLVSQEALLARQEQNDQALLVLDVRTPGEFAEGHIDGAINIPYDQLHARLADVPRDKDIVLYCRTGRRSDIAAGVLLDNGYTRVSHLEGDIKAWVEQDRPLTKP